MVKDWTITRRGDEPADFWSQSLCWGSGSSCGQGRLVGARALPQQRRQAVPAGGGPPGLSDRRQGRDEGDLRLDRRRRPPPGVARLRRGQAGRWEIQDGAQRPHALGGVPRIRSRAEGDRRTDGHRASNAPGSGLRRRMAEGRAAKPPGGGGGFQVANSAPISAFSRTLRRGRQCGHYVILAAVGAEITSGIRAKGAGVGGP